MFTGLKGVLTVQLPQSLTVLASRMNFFNFPRFYYVVFVWILHKFCVDFAWSFFLHARDFFSVAPGFRAWTDVSTHDTITSPQNVFSAKEDFLFSWGKIATLHCFRKYTNTFSHFRFWMNYNGILSVHINFIWIFQNIAVCMAKREDPDQAPFSAASDLELHCLHRPICPNS